MELIRPLQRRQVARETEFSPLAGVPEPGQKFAPEHPSEDGDREEVVVTAGDPAALVVRESAAGDDAMDVRVQREVLAPGVQHRQHADVSPEVLRVRGHLKEGFRGSPHEQAVHHAGVGKRHRAEGAGKREHDVEVRCVEQVGGLGLQPARGVGPLTLGTMAIAARVIGDFLMSTLQTSQDMSSQGGGTARGQVVEGAALHGRQARTVLLQKRVATAPDHLGHFEPRSGHG